MPNTQLKIYLNLDWVSRKARSCSILSFCQSTHTCTPSDSVPEIKFRHPSYCRFSFSSPQNDVTSLLSSGSNLHFDCWVYSRHFHLQSRQLRSRVVVSAFPKIVECPNPMETWNCMGLQKLSRGKTNDTNMWEKNITVDGTALRRIFLVHTIENK